MKYNLAKTASFAQKKFLTPSATYLFFSKKNISEVFELKSVCVKKSVMWSF